MHIEQINIDGYKGFGAPFSINFSKGLNVIVGENAAGKSCVIDAIRLLFNENEFGNRSIQDTDFFSPISNPTAQSDSFSINCVLDGLSAKEKIAYLPWTTPDETARLNLLVDNKLSNRGFFKRKIWGGESQSSIFEWDLFDELITCIYLPPLRDAESRLTEGKYSRLARLLKKTHKKEIEESRAKGELHPLEKDVHDFNMKLSGDPSKPISLANDQIRKKLQEAMGNVFGQSTLIQFSESKFNRIVENLHLLFYHNVTPPEEKNSYRSLEENSLGYNNLLYLATVLAELTTTVDEDSLKLLLIEEPEAHLHPQLQMKLLNYLEKVSREQNVQVIVTTHSPILASAIPLDSIIHLQRTDENCVQATQLKKCGLDAHSTRFINRWLSVTKSTLLFSRGIIFVEGIAEAMLIPALAKLALSSYHSKCASDENLPKINGNSLEELGISVINMNGIYFKHFMQFFCDIDSAKATANIPLRCAGITDNDPPKSENADSESCDEQNDGKKKSKKNLKPTPSSPLVGTNHALKLQPIINSSKFSRLYSSPLKTLEYDLAFEKENLPALAKVLYSIWPLTDKERAQGTPPINTIRYKLLQIVKCDIGKLSEQEIADNAFYLLQKIENNEIGKGFYAQELTNQINSQDISVGVPEYIYKAIIWACGGNPDA